MFGSATLRARLEGGDKVCGTPIKRVSRQAAISSRPETILGPSLYMASPTKKTLPERTASSVESLSIKGFTRSSIPRPLPKNRASGSRRMISSREYLGYLVFPDAAILSIPKIVKASSMVVPFPAAIRGVG